MIALPYVLQIIAFSSSCTSRSHFVLLSTRHDVSRPVSGTQRSFGTRLLSEEKRSPRPQYVPPSYRCIRNLSPSTAKAAATAYTHINVATILLSVRTLAMQNLSFVWVIYIHYIQKYWQTAEECTPVQLSLRTVKHKNRINYTANCVSSSARAQ